MKSIYTGFISIWFLAACSNAPQSNIETKAEAEPTEVSLNNEEKEIADIQLASIEKRAISSTIQASGMLDVPPNSKVTIAAPTQGFITNTYVLQGSKVNKGDKIAELKHQDIVQLQQDYLDYKSQLNYLQLEAKRQEELSAENINAKKAAQQAQAAYQSMQAKVKGMKAKLKLIGIDAIELEKGEIQTTVNINSPISGYVTQVNVNLGSFVNSSDVLFTVVNTEHLHAELTVFERDVPKIKVNQHVVFTLSNETEQRTAHVHLIGREIKADRSVQIHCHLDKEDKELLPGTYLKAIIETSETRVSTLPNDAFVNFEGKDYVFIETQNNTYEIVNVTKGSSENGFTELKGDAATWAQKKFVTKGAYTLLAKMKNSDEE